MLCFVYANDSKVVNQGEETGGIGKPMLIWRGELVDITPVVPETCWTQVFMTLHNLILPDFRLGYINYI